MNQEDIMKALEICADSCGNCEDCPLGVLPGGVPDCMNKLIREARKLILSLLEKQNADAGQKPEPWTRKRVLSEAERCVCGKREQDYGTPEDNFDRIAKMWSAYMGVEFNPVDVSMFMVMLKAARIKSGGGTMDSFVDGCGYFSCGGEIFARNMESGERV